MKKIKAEENPGSGDDLRPLFDDGSHEFRPGRGAHIAVREGAGYVEYECGMVVEIDISRSFDHIRLSHRGITRDIHMAVPIGWRFKRMASLLKFGERRQPNTGKPGVRVQLLPPFEQ